MFQKIKSYLRKILSEDFILWTHKVRGMLALFLYGNPSKTMKVIGVTGTNGKTTTCHIINEILSGSEAKVGMLTTIDFQIGEEVEVNESKMTTLNPFILQKKLSQMSKAGCDYAIVETTSHAIEQYRNWGIKYHTVVLTNITHDHLDYHKTFKSYRASKLKLFENNPEVSVINRDDESWQYFQEKEASKKYFYAIENYADLITRKFGVIAKKIILKSDRTLFTLITPEGQIAIDTPLTGKFNVYNTLAAVCVGLGENIPLEKIKESLEDLKNISGRMQRLDYGQNFDVIVDFAHTPDGLKNVFEAVKPSVSGRLIHVGGATGNRDKSKRPILGALAGKYADIVIVTNEDPYSEDPESIINAVALGVPRGGKEGKNKIINKNFFKISNRKSAIMKAIQMAKFGDLVLITGKGCETKMAVGENKFIPWSDVEIVKEFLKGK